MIILRDTREQNPLEFNFKNVEKVISTKLDVGDYACQFSDGVIAPVFFERKSKGDLFGTLGKGHKRFRKEIQRAIDNHYKFIIIVECGLMDVLSGFEYKTKRGCRYSRINGTSIAKTLFTLWIKYGVFPVFCKDREEMSNYIYATFVALEKQYKKGK